MFSCEENILNGVQFLLSEENLQKLVEEGEKNSEKVLTREEKADLEVFEESVVAEEVKPCVDDADLRVEDGTKGGHFDLLPVSNVLQNMYKTSSI